MDAILAILHRKSVVNDIVDSCDMFVQNVCSVLI